MYVRSLRLKDFRNYEWIDLRPSEGLNVFVGANAQGKTNLLESIYLLSTLRPIRAARDIDLIQWDKDESSLELTFMREDLPSTLAICLSSRVKRILRFNAQPVTRSIEFIGRLATVCFTSQDLSLVKGEPTDRRRFLDNEIGTLSHRYLYSLVHYRRCLDQRNNLIRAHLEGHGSLDTLEEWNLQLVRYGSRLLQSRAMFLQELNQKVSSIHHELSGGVDQIALHYLPGLLTNRHGHSEEEWTELFNESLHKQYRQELRRGMTMVGPHRDDFMVLINQKDARLYASQGQQRTAALSLRLAEIRLYEDHLHEAPVVLLDDVFSDLDPNRRRYLMQFLHERYQTFITCTDLGSFSKEILKQAQIFRIAEGEVISDQ